MNEYIITNASVNELAKELLSQKWNVISETADGVSYKPLAVGEEVKLDPKSKPTHLSPKEYFFPKTETLFYYKTSQSDVELIDNSDFAPKTVLLGVKPCDAIASTILSKVFNWDYKDEFFNKRVENTVIIGMKCGYVDNMCFCTSVELSPESTKGSDVFLIPAENNTFIAQSITEKGEKFIKDYNKFFETSNGNHKPIDMNNQPPKKFDSINVKDWLDKNFESTFWKGLGDLCLGCAQCTYVCPTCHCFDIVDENYDYHSGRRVKNWDCCQYTMFTKHASGHNPRKVQSDRYRQRVNHKFKYYNDRFDTLLCTGCGRCIRGCGVGISIADVMQEIDKLNLNKNAE